MTFYPPPGSGQVPQSNVSCYYSNDMISWLLVSQITIPASSFGLWGLAVYASTGTPVVNFDYLAISGILNPTDTNYCSLNNLCSNTNQGCVPDPSTTFVECSQNQWRYAFVAANPVAPPSFSVSQYTLEINSTIPISTQKNDQYAFMFKIVTLNTPFFQILAKTESWGSSPNSGTAAGFCEVTPLQKGY